MKGFLLLHVGVTLSLSSLAAAATTHDVTTDADALITGQSDDMAKLNTYLQAEKENEINVESLYADMQKRFEALKQEWVRADSDRQTMRKSLAEARKNVETLSKQNKRLSQLFATVRQEQVQTLVND